MNRSSKLYCIPSASIQANSSNTDSKSLIFGDMPGKQNSPLLISPCLYKVIYNERVSKNDTKAPFTN